MNNTLKNKSITFEFISDIENVFTNKRIKVLFEDGSSLIFIFTLKNTIEVEGVCEFISNYQLSEIEDGLFNLICTHNKKMINCIFDLHRNVCECNTVEMVDFENQFSISNKKGSLELIFDSNEKVNKMITIEQKAVDFWTRFFDKHDETAINDYLTEPYIQHNPKVADGVEAFRNEFHDRFFTDMKECSTVVKRVSSRDNLVFIHNILKRNPTVKGHAAVDIFRFENGKIVEHWDVIQPMPEKSKNDHPMF